MVFAWGFGIGAYYGGFCLRGLWGLTLKGLITGGLISRGLCPGFCCRRHRSRRAYVSGIICLGGGALRKAALVLVAYARGFMTGIYVRLLLRKKPSLR